MPHQSDAHIEQLLDQMTVDELVLLTAGDDVWHTAAIERLGIPRMRVSDGPVGVRGTSFDGEASINAPCSTSLAATWDTEAVEQIGQMLSRELQAKGAHVLLAPTVNLHRTPVGGRNFECMSEDAYLTSRIAVAYVRGVQHDGLACCIKHFVGNDTEFERMSIDSQIDERTLREMYLRPFEAAVQDAGVKAVMTSYNRVDGVWAADSSLLADVLRGEWGFEGTVMSDWFGLHSTVEGIESGLDLEMPGPTLHRGAKLLAAIERGDVTVEQVRARARQVLWLLDRTGALAGSGPAPETARRDAADEALVRRVSAQGMVLLRNGAAVQGGTVLPLTADVLAARGVRTVAVIGPNAARCELRGGGSAQVTPTVESHPLEAITARLAAQGIGVEYAQGCQIHRRLPAIESRLMTPFECDIFEHPEHLDEPGRTPVSTSVKRTTRVTWFEDPLGKGSGDPEFGARLHTTFTPDVSGSWSFGLESVSPGRILIDGAVVLDNTDEPKGGSFFGTGRGEITTTVELVAGRAYHLVAEVRHHPQGIGLGGINIGAVAPVTGDLVEAAIDLAARCDLTILVVGTNDNWESEGWDRTDIGLPGRQDELITRVAQVSKATVVVVNAGSPVGMPWLDAVDGVLMAWFPGQGAGEAIVDVLTGDVEPQGRLPVTFPMRIEDTPASEHHPGRNGVARYLEGRLVGHQWYTTIGRDPLFPFGFGLGYGCVAIDSAAATSPYEVVVSLSNAGSRDAIEVVQVYAHQLDRDDLPRDEPEQRLVGFAKVHVAAGTTVQAHIALDQHAYRSWDILHSCWTQRAGAHELRVGRSAADVVHRLEVRP